MSAKATPPRLELSRRYAAALRKRLAGKPGSKAPSAGGLGRDAAAIGLGASDVVRIHERALRGLPPSASQDGMLARTTGFLVEALRPIEKNHGAAVKGDGHLDRLRRTKVQRQLEDEIRRRKVAQKALEEKARRYSELLEKSHLMQEHLRRLSHEILSAHEEERRKISRELHDEVGQILTAVNVKLATLKRAAALNTTDLKRKIGSTQRLVERTMSTVHRFARELRPPLLDDLGLIPALHAHMKEFTRRTHVPVHFKVFAAVERLGMDKRIVLYRVVQEALANVAKHAQASAVEVTVQRTGEVVGLEVHDDGKGFAVDRVLFARPIRRLGLLGMRERVEMVGGVCQVESKRGEGTTIRVQIPYRGGRLPAGSRE